MLTKRPLDGYRTTGFFMFRTPLLPVDTLLTLVGNDAVVDDGTYAAARVATRERLAALVADPIVREALAIASPSLVDALSAWSMMPDGDARRKLDQALLRYLARMTSRATPFGLFAGCSLGYTAAATRLYLAPRGEYRRHLRLDMQVLCSLAEALSASPETRRALRFVATPSLSTVGGRMRFAQLPLGNQEDVYPNVDVEPTDHLALVLGASAEGKRPHELVAELRRAYPDVDEGEANGYVDALIENGLLVPEVLPAVTGPEPTDAFVATLASEAALAPTALTLTTATAQLAGIEVSPLGVPPEAYQSVVDTLGQLPCKVEPQKAFQLDLLKPVAEATLGPTVIEEMKRLIAFFALFPASGDPMLPRFAADFSRRYESQTVSLVEALDPESGVDFGPTTFTQNVPLLKDVPVGEGRPDAPVATWDTLDNFRLSKLSEALRARHDEIEIKDADLAPFAERAAAQSQSPVDALVVFGSLLAESAAAVDAGRFTIHQPNLSTPSGMALFGRFCHIDPDLDREVRKHLSLEDELAGDAILVDVVHLSNGRLGNIMLRPCLRPYEVVCHGRSGAPRERQIPASDLMVSVDDSRVTLYSKRLGRRIIPRITNAHNVPGDGTAAVYRFLSAVQQQDARTSTSWHWGAFSGSAYLPRVRYGRSVLANAQWRLSAEAVAPFVKASGRAQMAALTKLREELRLPRWVAVSDYDNVMPFDLDNPLCVEALAQFAKSRSGVTIEEYPLASCATAVEGPEGRYLNELVVPFTRRNAGDAARAPEGERTAAAPLAAGGAPSRADEATIPGEANRDEAAGGLSEDDVPLFSVGRRSFSPGSEVLYAKLYMGDSGVDPTLFEVAAPIVRDAMRSGAVKQWFYIRYGDPDRHLRLRFFGDRVRLAGEVLPALEASVAPLIDGGRMWKLQLDSYEREVERYGGPLGVALAERLFWADSEACLAVIERLAEVDSPDGRWHAAALGIDALLADFGHDMPARLGVVRRAAEAFAREFSVGKDFRHAMGKKFRESGAALVTVLGGGGGDDPVVERAREAYALRSEALAPVVRGLARAAARGELTGDTEPRIWSYLHMHVIRILVGYSRSQELVLYHLMEKAYVGLLSRGTKGGR